MKQELWQRIAGAAGTRLDDRQIDLLELYRAWLEKEAFQAGGIGPGELDRIDTRHIGDSLLFARELDPMASEVWDLGSGVGLPGIPLAILRPETDFLLIDRAGRRAQLMRRAVRILELENVEVLQAEITHLREGPGYVVSRATLAPEHTAKLLEDLLAPGGRALVGGSWVKRPEIPGWETVDVGSDILDQPVWLLIMRRE